jgi:hypothetical protein
VIWAIANFSQGPPENPAIDLLAQIDLNRDPVNGTWSLDSDVLSSSEKDAVATLRLPHTMPAEFQLEITAHRRSGVDLMFVNRSEATPFAVAFSVKASAAGGRSEESEAPAQSGSVFNKGWAIENRHPQTFVFHVKKDRLLVQRDGQTLIDRPRYTDLPKDLKAVPDRLGFFIVTEESKYEFSQILFTPLGKE